MSKPTTPGELRDVKIDTISLVSKAANKKTFKIFKSAGNESVDAPPEQAPATVSKDERGLFDVLKSYFSGGDVQKGEVADKFNAAEKSRRFYELTDALQSSIGYSRYGDSKK
ncbi:MAG: hypothetical protein LBT23_01485, partial [Synergistaceae bacterium]|nr:hypothetical protein [Synergistaceae bacterium]